jgi:NADPH2:quinone reductase
VKAIVLNGFGGPEMLQFQEIQTPEPGPGEVLIQVHNVSVNVTLDIIVRKGLYPRKPPLPHILGVDPTGEVVGLGDGVTSHRIGDRVTVHTSLRSSQCVPGEEARDPGPDEMIGIHRWGGYAEFVAVPAENAFKIPDKLSYEEANVTMRHLPTARHLLHCDAALQPGETVLVMGASGGLASMCIQVAKRMGATVIGAAGSDDRVATGIAFGADHGINYRTQDLAAEVRKLTDGKGVEVVAENIGDPELWPGAFNSLAKHGRLVTAGAHGGGQVTLNLQSMYLRRITIIGDPGCDFPDIDWALEQAADGGIRAPLVDRVMPLHEAAEAHRLIEARETAGKILLDPIASASVRVA